MKPLGDSSVLGAARERFQGLEYDGLGSVLTCYYPASLAFSQVTVVFQSQISTFPKADVKSCNADRVQGPPALPCGAV